MARNRRPARIQALNSLRIIGGKWRGRKLHFADAEGLRPTGDRIRETLFNWLMAEIPGTHCLDLFSGSGALAIEALSRGATTVTLVESSPEVAAQLARNLEKLGAADDSDLVIANALQWLDQAAPQRYQVVFVDPPFGLNLWSDCLQLLHSRGWLAQDACVYVERPRGTVIAVPDNWSLHREKHAGDVNFSLFRVTASIAI